MSCFTFLGDVGCRSREHIGISSLGIVVLVCALWQFSLPCGGDDCACRVPARVFLPSRRQCQVRLWLVFFEMLFCLGSILTFDNLTMYVCLSLAASRAHLGRTAPR